MVCTAAGDPISLPGKHWWGLEHGVGRQRVEQEKEPVWEEAEPNRDHLRLVLCPALGWKA